jgi:hypothetical protein
MIFDVSYFSSGCNTNPSEQSQSMVHAIDKDRILISLFLFSAIIQFSGCVSDKVEILPTGYG